jgi:hypothetical protein
MVSLMLYCDIIIFTIWYHIQVLLQCFQTISTNYSNSSTTLSFIHPVDKTTKLSSLFRHINDSFITHSFITRYATFKYSTCHHVLTYPSTLRMMNSSSDLTALFRHHSIPSITSTNWYLYGSFIYSHRR